jgi:hypothetical protein
MKRRAKRRKRKGGRGRALITLFLFLLITLFGVSIFLGRGWGPRTPEAPKVRQASLDLPAPEPDIVPDAASPTLVIKNGCGRAGLGARVGHWMRHSGFDVFETGNADRADYPKTLIVVRSGRNEASNRIASFLKTKLGVGEVVEQLAKAPEADVILILGSDFPDSLPGR